MSEPAMTVWVLTRRGDDDHEQLWYAGVTQEQCAEVLGAQDRSDLADYWWRIREHYVGSPVP